MKGDVAIAGFVLTAEEWQALDAFTRAQLVTAAARADERWGIAAARGLPAEPAAVTPNDE